MAPISIDLTSDFDAPVSLQQNATDTTGRSLILACPSAAAHEDYVGRVFEKYPRSRTDLQMMDRLAGGLVSIPESTYSLVMLLVGPDGCWRHETSAFLSRDMLASLAAALKPGGVLRNEDNSGLDAAGTKEAVLAGLVGRPDGSFGKPDYEEAAVPLRLGGLRGKANGARAQDSVGGASDANGGAHSSAGPAVDTMTVDVNGKKETLNMVPPAAKPALAGVGFDDLLGDDEDDDDLIDEDTLLDGDDMFKPIQQPPECKPRGKRRACADCTCGLAARLEAKDKARRAQADNDLETLKLKSEDLSELDFTVPGKTGSCGSCSLGDAFRCADCPYLGLPPFRPGEEVKIINNVAQF